MDEFMDEFMDAMKEVFPNLLVQFEDFSTDNAFRYLNRFREKYRCFNDDVSFYGCAALDPMLTKFRVGRSKAPARSCCLA
jgi:malate dehydrogenase (oxaloacetate-decarboxylating)(NADP+)